MTTHPLIVYQPDTADDLLLVEWYRRLSVEAPEDFAEAFGEKSISKFLATFGGNNGLIYSIKDDDCHVWFAAWFEPAYDGAMMGLWVDPRMRGSKASVETLIKVHEQVLSIWPVILVVTRKDSLLENYRRMGYTVLGKVPRLYQGSDAWLAYITPEAANEVRLKWEARLQKKEARARPSELSH